MTFDDQMILRIDGEVLEANAGVRLGDLLKGRPYQKGSVVAVIRSPETVRAETDEFEVRTSKGSMVIRLDDSEFASVFRRQSQQIAGKSIRWRTSKVLAVGAFPTDLVVNREEHRYSRFDCFLALGGFDSRTTYLMIARTDHEGRYGVAGGVIGRVTRGRHVLERLEEGDKLTDIVPIVLELSEKDALVTDDMNLNLEEGMAIESQVGVRLNGKSPVSCEHFLVVTEKGTLRVTDATSTYAACSARMHVSLIAEEVAVREEGRVTVRHDGPGTGRIYLYRTRRQLSPSHNHVGEVSAGRELVRLAPEGSTVTLVPDPARIMTIGMTQAEGEEFLKKRGLRQSRKGEASDDSIIVEQEPELTMEAIGA
ncbi:MAG: methanogenesis marker 3 protein, partial [Euryarchaeota archaeon]|nr:methanogenesis marker 3 protein [Euryarchaeota archaeon]